MDGFPVQIIDIEKDANTQKSTYNFNIDALRNSLNEVNSIEVAVISIAGPSRQGKSFLLSYLLRYLSNPNDNSWIGKDDEPLEGFKWNYGTKPETKGVWIWSKPFIVKQSVDEKLAIIIMDTQGVYDEYTDLRDWSTIVGITLLTSSCFIFNVLNDIQENVLTQLETFMNYGLLAIERDEKNKHSFQRLLFLIRDWNSPREHNYGRTGGNDYITEKLSIKSSQPQQSQRTRKLIKQCFEDVTCYLMPEPGAKKNDEDFNGSVDKLSSKFVSKLKELFYVLLNPESLKPKLINGNTITGRDLLKYFEVFVEKFNGDELPQPMDLVEAVTKATDLNLIYKLKESYHFRMNQELQTKQFLSKNELKILSNSITSEINEEFKDSRKSQNNDIVKQLTQTFETELKNVFFQIHSVYEKRREKIANDTIAKCINIYYESINKFMTENSFVKAIYFDKQLIESKNLAKKYFTEIFGVEENDTFAPYSLKINKSIEEIEDSFRAVNHRRKHESKIINTQAVNNSLTLYREQFESIIDKKVFLASEKFSQLEQEIRSKALEYFTNNCSGDQGFVEKSNDLMKLKLDAEKSELETFNRNKTKEIMDKTEAQLSFTINYCKQRLSETLELFSGSEDLNQINADIKQETIEMFEHNCNVEDSNFLNPYMNKLGTEIDKILVGFNNVFKAKAEDLNHFYKNTIEEAMNKCFVETLFEGKSIQSEEESITFRANLIKDVIKKYENVPKKEKFNEIKDFVFESSALAADQLLIERLVRNYCKTMTETLRTKKFFSREELSQVHSEKSGQVIETFKAHNKTSNPQLLQEFIVKLNNNLKAIFDEFHSHNEQNREKCVKKAIDNSLCLYEECMTQFIKDVCIESNKFDEFNTESKTKALTQLNDVCGEEKDKELTEFYISKLSKLIETAEYKFRSENDTKLKEAKRKNSEAVNNSLEYYSEQMYKALNENLFHSEESFKRYEENVREESFNIFTDNCKYGEKEFISQFELDLNNKIIFSKSKFKSNFRKKAKVLESEIVVEINDALNQYNDYMNLLLDIMKDEQQFSSKNNEVKAKAIDIFKQKCLLKDDEYRVLQISKLEKAINDSCNQIHDRFLNQLKKSENSYEKFVNKSFASYAQLMNDLFKDNISISEGELESLHQNKVRDVLSEFEDNFQNEVDVSIIESNRRALEIKITNEFQSIKSTNNMRNESNESSNMELTDQIQDNFKVHKDRIEKMIPFSGDNVEKDVFSEFEDNFTFNEGDFPVLESNREALEIKNTNAFQSIERANSYESNEKSDIKLNLEIKEFVHEYEEGMKNMIPFCGNETELLEQHLEIENIIKENMITSNPFSNPEALEPYLTQLEVEIKKSFIDLSVIFKVNLDKQIETAGYKFQSENDIKLKEEKRKNSEAVNNSLEYYSEQMNKALNENLFHSEESFKRYEKNVREESFNTFTNNCKYGEKEFINQFELDLNNEIKFFKSKFKSNFRNKAEVLQLEIVVEINDALNQYNDYMNLLLDIMKDEQQFSSKHDEAKAKAIDIFKQKCLLKDDEYRLVQISKLEKAINDSCNQIHDRFLDQLKKSENSYEKFVNKSFASYAQLMTDLFKDNISISERELENLHQNIVRDVLSEFEDNFQNEVDVSIIESNRRALDIKITNEFQSIKSTNNMRNESKEKLDMKLKLEIQDYVNEYEDRMEKLIAFCGNENDLFEKHLEVGNIIKENMIASNPFSNPEALEPYLTQFEEELNKSFTDFNVIFKVNLDKQFLSLQNVITNARKFYKEEMQKYYANTNFLKPEKLILFNSSVTERTIAKYRSERGNMSIEKFDIAIKDSLKDIYNNFVEENDINTPTLPSIGIDLGTTNSCVAYYQPSKPKGKTIIIPNDLGNKTTPSVVAFTRNNEEVIGEAAKEESYRRSRNTIYSAKRLIGRQFDDKNVQNDMILWPFKVVDDGNNIAKISVKVGGNDKVFFPEEISAKILKKLKQMAENHLGCAVKNAVITVPAYFNEAQKEATKDAGRIAGLNVLKIINEPTAAALAFQLNRSDELDTRKVLIFDFGGGTLDVVIIAIERGVINIKAVGGDNHLGGDDIDAKLVDFCLNDFTTKTNIQIDKTSEDGENALRRLTTECEKRKRQLSSTNSVHINIDHFYDKDLSCELTRKKFEELNIDLFVKSIDLVAQVLCDANLEHSDIDDVVLVGGTTRIPKIQDMLTDMFYGKPLNRSVDPDEAVAVGAAIQAAILNGNLAQSDNHLRVSDVTPMSLGVKVRDGFMSVIIHRNSKVPNKCTKQYETTTDNQTEVDIEIYEGEETLADDNRKLGTFTLSNIPPGPVGSQQIEVNFIINDEGILHVKAKIMSNDEEEEILITEHKGRLTNAELQQLIDQDNL